jgi:phosphoribosylaminoimidazole-succinocarboxamide synthase
MSPEPTGSSAAGVLLDTTVAGGSPWRRGKVRDVYAAGEGRLVIVATDRISAYDVVLPNGIPDKGRVLTQISAFWFELLARVCPHHMITCDVREMPAPFSARADVFAGRSMLVRQTEPFPVECVVRGFLAGSAWREYKASGTVAGETMPRGLTDGAALGEPIFTPSTKAETGHDENITFAAMRRMIGVRDADLLRERSLAIFEAASAHAASRGLTLVDTKFEFGRDGSEVLLIDEVLTPDSSRFWERGDDRRVSFDKQFVRDWLDASGWDHDPPAPELPPDVVQRTSDLYRDAFRRLTGRELERAR